MSHFRSDPFSKRLNFEVTYFRSDPFSKWLHFEVTYFRSDPFSRWLNFEVTYFRSDPFSKWLKFEVTHFRSDSISKWPIFKVTHFWSDSISKWPIFEVTHFRRELFSEVNVIYLWVFEVMVTRFKVQNQNFEFRVNTNWVDSWLCRAPQFNFVDQKLQKTQFAKLDYFWKGGNSSFPWFSENVADLKGRISLRKSENLKY